MIIWKKLKIFTTVAERGSISGSSKELALSQPAITRAIQTLEPAVGFALFSRGRNGMHLTEGGHILCSTSVRLLKEISDASVKGAHAQEKMVGNIIIGTYESLAEYLWPNFLLIKSPETLANQRTRNIYIKAREKK